MDLFHGDLRRVHEAAQSMFRIHLDLARKFGYEKTPIGHVEEIVLE